MIRFKAKKNTTVEIAIAENILVGCSFFNTAVRADIVCIQSPDNPPSIDPKIG